MPSNNDVINVLNTSERKESRKNVLKIEPIYQLFLSLYLVHGPRVKICSPKEIFGNPTFLVHFVVLSPNFDVSTQISYSLGRYWGFILASPPKRGERRYGNERYL